MILYIGLLSSIDRRIEFIIWGKIQLRVYSEIRHASHKKPFKYRAISHNINCTLVVCQRSSQK